MTEFVRTTRAMHFVSHPLNRGILETHVLSRRLEKAFHDAAETFGQRVYAGHSERLRYAAVAFTRAGETALEVPDELRKSGTHRRTATGVADDSQRTAQRDPYLGIPQTPAKLNRYWSGLSTEKKDALHRAHPSIGNRDGIPYADRDHYNRKHLEDLRAAAANQGDEKSRNHYNELSTMLNSQKGGQPPYYLSHIDGNMKFSFALGNPDTADNIAIVVFPAGGGAAYYAERTLKPLRDSAHAADPESETSVILWNVYDNPKSLPAALFPPSGDAPSALREMHEGLRVTHQGEPSHNTTIGHSYGATTIGHSARTDNPLNTDDVVMMGSIGPGAHIRSVEDIGLKNVPKEDTGRHVHTTIAPHDSIKLMPTVHGPDPADPSFGAQVFETHSTPREGSGQAVNTSQWNPNAHFPTVILDPDNPSYAQIGRIIAGVQ